MGGRIDRGSPGALGSITAGCEGADAPFVHAGPGCGVGRQYTGSAGKITNCQIGVFACYVSWHGHAFIERTFIVSDKRSLGRCICRRPGRTIRSA
jgi:hypothetical protein